MKAASAGKQLSQGTAIEYKAFKRSFYAGEDGVLYLIATCSYGTPKFTLFFEEAPGKNHFNLMEIPPEGIVPQIVTYYVASWTNGVSAAIKQLKDVTITDAHGEHTVNVQSW